MTPVAYLCQKGRNLKNHLRMLPQLDCLKLLNLYFVIIIVYIITFFIYYTRTYLATLVSYVAEFAISDLHVSYELKT